MTAPGCTSGVDLRPLTSGKAQRTVCVACGDVYEFGPGAQDALGRESCQERDCMICGRQVCWSGDCVYACSLRELHMQAAPAEKVCKLCLDERDLVPPFDDDEVRRQNLAHAGPLRPRPPSQLSSSTDTKQLLAFLEHPDASLRHRALQLIRDDNRDDPDLVPLVEPLSGDPDDRVRARAPDALLALARPDLLAAALPRLLDDPSPRVRRHACVAVAQTGLSSPEIAAAAARALLDPDRKTHVADYAARCVNRAIGSKSSSSAAAASAVLASALEDFALRQQALFYLGTFGPVPAGVVERVRELSRAGDLNALRCWNRFESPADDRVAALLDSLRSIGQSPNFERQEHLLKGSIDELSGLGQSRLEAWIPRIVELARSAKPPIGSMVAGALGKACPRSEEACDFLLQALRSDDTTLRAGAASGLGHMLPFASRIVPALVDYIEGVGRDTDPSKRTRADRPAEALESLASEAPEQFSRIAALLEHPSGPVRGSAAKAIRTLRGHHDILPAMGRALRDSYGIAFDEAMDELAGAGPAALPILADALLDTTLTYRRRLLPIFDSMPDEVVARAVSFLPKLLDDPDESVRACAAKLLRKHASGDLDTLGAFAHSLSDTSARTRKAAYDSLVSAGAAAVPHFLARADDASKHARILAVEGLAKVGVVTPEVIATLLRRVLRETDFSAQMALAKALGSLASKDKAAISAVVAEALVQVGPGTMAQKLRDVARELGVSLEGMLEPP